MSHQRQALPEKRRVQVVEKESLSTVEEGAEAVVRLAASPDEVEGVTGRYFDGKREACANRRAYDERARRRLWAPNEELCGPFLEPSLRRS